MTRTIAVQAGGVVLLLGLVLGTLGPQSSLLFMVGALLTPLLLWTVAAPRPEPVPVRVKRHLDRR